MIDLFNVKNKIAVITGGSRGIGFMMAKGFITHGAKVYITSRKAEVCQKAAETLSALGGECIAIPSDLSKEEGIKHFAEEFKKHEDTLHILINNAGKAWAAPLTEFPDSAWDSVFAINLKSVFNLTREMIPFLKAAGSSDDPARVINIGSVAGEVAASMEAYSYGTSKAAVHHLTRILARELAPMHINVNAIAPGRFPSDMTTNVMNDKEAYAAELATIPMHRFGKEEDVAGTAIFLASPSSAYMTGNIIPLDGGHRISGNI
jgi:NAD(P)-dependent dehydrogenase (short-subunit alcohol dehydrogenase family)